MTRNVGDPSIVAAWQLSVAERVEHSITTFMKRTNECPKCGSRDIIANAKAIDRVDNGPLAAATMRNPDAVLFKGTVTSPLSAWVCADCGYLELYADNPKSLSSNLRDAI